MTASDFLREAERLGCEVLVDGPRVGLRGPPDAVAGLRAALGRLKPEILRLLRDGTAGGCACIVCRPGLWPKGFLEVTETWPAKYRARFEDGARAREAAGADSETARSLGYQAALAALNRDHRRGSR